MTSVNEPFERAMMEVCRWDMGEQELQRRAITNSWRYAALTAAVQSLGLGEKQRATMDEVQGEVGKVVLKVDGENEFFGFPETIEMPVDRTKSVALPIRFHAEDPGQYECYVTLSSAHDVRVFVIESTVMARGRFAELELCTAALQPLTQDIPLVSKATCTSSTLFTLVQCTCMPSQPI